MAHECWDEDISPAGFRCRWGLLLTDGWLLGEAGVSDHYRLHKDRLPNHGRRRVSDVTPAILIFGYTGRDINPQTVSSGKKGVAFVPPPTQPPLPTAQVAASGPTANAAVATVGCADPSPAAIIRLARVRDNP